MTTPAICLVMIVNNEADFIVAALDSVLPYISEFVVVDSGSTDGTQDIIKNYFLERLIPGNIYHNDFESGAAQRTAAMKHSIFCGDYRLFIDADNILEVTIVPEAFVPNPFDNLTLDAYSIRKKMANVEYGGVIQLMRSDLDWIYEGVIHELPVLANGKEFTVAELDRVMVHEAEKFIVDDPAECINSRYRLRSHYLDHARILEEEIFKHRTDPLPERLLTRYFFYTGNSYYDAGEYAKALPFYRTRAMQQGYAEEVYYSLYMVAVCMHHLQDDEDKVMMAYIEAWDYRPQRMEAAFALMHNLFFNNMNNLALVIGSTTKSLQPCKDALLMHMDLYNGDFDKLLQVIREKRKEDV